MNTLRIVILGTILIALGACSSAGKCKRGEPGCACQTGNTCVSDARCVAERCTKSTAAVGGRGGSSGGGGSDSNMAGRDSSDKCSAASFDAACRSYCLAFCDSQSAFCEHSVCTAEFCDSANYTTSVLPVCKRICGDDAICAREMCLDQRHTTCETFSFEADGGVVPACFDDDPKCELSSD